MLEGQVPNPRKRQRPEPPQSRESSHSSQPKSKKQRPIHPNSNGSQTLASVWDNLSKVWLTKGALRELDRRNIQAARSLPPSPHRRTRQPSGQADTILQTAQNHASCLHEYWPRPSKDIELFAKHGGPDLSDLRNVCIAKYLLVGALAEDTLQYPEPLQPSSHIMSSRHSSSQSRKQGSGTTSGTKSATKTTSTKTSGAYSRNFQQILIDNDIYPHGYRHPDGRIPAKPNNWEDVRQRLARYRSSLSPSRFTDEECERKYGRFVYADANTSKEKQVSETVMSIVEGEITDLKGRSGGIPFNNLDPLTNSSIKPGNPDVYYGARPEELSKTVRNDLGGRIIPSTQDELPVAPNFFVAAKGPDGSLTVAGKQACYDGALGARGMNSLHSYPQAEPIYDNNARTITSIYHGGTLKMYTSHVAPPSSPEGRPRYYMTHLDFFAMAGTPEKFREGLRAYRNGWDWAKEQRDELIERANERADSNAAVSNVANISPASSFVTAASDTELYNISQESRTSLNEIPYTQGDLQGSDTSTEERADYRLSAKRSGKRLERPQSQRKRQNASGSSNAGHYDELTAMSTPEGASTAHTTTECSETWSWVRGRFQCHKGHDLVKEQDETPVDVWIHYDQGWPGQGEKKWRLWISATQEILYA